jgi:hypothetical protein
LRIKPLLVLQSVVVALFNAGCSKLLPEGSGGSVGASARAGDFIATLIQTQEGSMPALHRNPENDRYRLSLRLDPVDGGSKRMVKLGDGLRASDYLHAARFLGDDGERIWFHAQEVMAYDHRSHRLIRGSELQRFTEPKQKGLFPRTEPKEFLEPVEKYEPRYTRARMVLDGAGGKPLHVEDPEGHLITYRLRPGLEATVGLVRLTAAGEEVWKADTGLQDLHQILPDGKVIAFLGKQLPKFKDEVRGPVLVLVDVKTGQVTSHLFWNRQ